ncbi:MAG TPA: hypothetical protein VLA83_10600 [Candidatus Binatia bacterium]|nr:hypothetical protein [Candidatus Binatia bacterium]
MSPELETLDQLLGGTMPLITIRELYRDDAAFLRGVLGLLTSGDVRLFSEGKPDVPQWHYRALFTDGSILEKLAMFRLDITDQGTQRIL